MLRTGPLTTESGFTFENAEVAFETWGTLNAARDNAVLVCHALSGDSHAVGWWDRLVGPGKAIDPAKHFIIGSNALGGCQGTTGPASLAPDGRKYGSRFPVITIGDMVELQARLLDHLGIDRLLLACGGSMGGMQALEWSRRFPARIANVWMTASCRAHNAMQIGINEAMRQAIRRDSNWEGGDYLPERPPTQGLAVARIIGHISYLSEPSFESKFGRRIQDGRLDAHGQPQFQVESYLNYQGDKFTQRFDAGSLVSLTYAIDRFSAETIEARDTRFLFTAFSSDWLYPPQQSLELYELARAGGCDATYRLIDLPYGHDAFLLDGTEQAAALTRFLA